MRLYEFTGSWEIPNGIQIAYIVCNARSKKDAEGIIHMSVPFHIDLDRAKSYEYSKSTGDDVKLWYFDSEGKEHHDTYKGVRI